jgi:LysM repeat protein
MAADHEADELLAPPKNARQSVPGHPIPHHPSPANHRLRRRRVPWGVIGVFGSIVFSIAFFVIAALVYSASEPQSELRITIEFKTPPAVITAALATPSPPTAPSPIPSPTPIEYVVQEGDTCIDIALRFRVDLENLFAANQLDPRTCVILIGQRLLIPQPDFVAAIGDANAMCQGRGAGCQGDDPIIFASPTPRATYDAPLLLAPADGAHIGEDRRVVTLQWLTVGLLRPNEWYVVQVQPTGAVSVPIFETKATSLRVTSDILGERQAGEVIWWVQVRRLMGIDPLTGQRIYADLSPPSAARALAWRRR